jgi:hypothetical protein
MKRNPVKVLIAAGLALAGPVAWAQEVLPLRGTLDDTMAAAPLATTSLAITPLDSVAAPRRKAAAAATNDPPGVAAGAFVLHPALTLGTVFTSNLKQSADHRVSAVGAVVKPSLALESDWVRHGLTASATGTFIHYAGHSDLDVATADVTSDLRLDVRRATTADLTASYHLDQAGPGSSEVPVTATGVARSHALDGGLAITRDSGHVSARLAGDVGLWLYDDVALSGGGSEDNGDRNHVAPTASLRLTGNNPAVIKPYVEVAYEPRFYLRTTDRNGTKRSSQGYGAALGAVIDDGPIWSGDVALTYHYRDYQDASLADGGILGAAGRLVWSPGDLTRIVFSLGTALNDDFTGGSSLGRQWSLQADLTQSVRDNIDLLAGAGITLDKGTGGEDVTYQGKLGLDWTLGPSLAWSAGYDVTWLDAATGKGYVEHRIETGLTIRR